MYNIRDLYEWYPLLPGNYAADDSISNIVDIKVYVTLDVGNQESADYAVNDDVLVCRLIGMTSTVAIIGISGTAALVGGSTIEVPVYEGQDALPANVSTGYVIVRNKSIPYNGSYVIHPDCVVVGQRAPVITFYDRGPIHSNDGINGADGAVGPSTAVVQEIPTFSNGHNVTVEYLGTSLVFTSGDKLGLGIYTVPPYVEQGLTYDIKTGVGLRSINGHYDNVHLAGARSVALSDSGASGNVQITISPVILDD